MSSDDQSQRVGTFAALLAYLMWGFLPIYWRWLHDVPALELLAHRVLWATVLLAPIVMIFDRRNFRTALRDRASIAVALIAGLMLTGNWFIYLWAISAERLVEASLGYYINPLVSVLLGVVFLRERLTRIQVVALFSALAGVLVLTVTHGRVPWISLALAASFGVYGLVKKVGRLGSLVGLFVEMWLVAPAAAAYLIVLQRTGHAAFASGNPVTTILLTGAGVFTVMPLFLFGAAARRIPLSRVGFLQYIAPTTMLIIGTLLFGEPFATSQAASFGLIWVALGLYTFSLIRHRNSQRATRAA